ncbi:MAG TPA: class I SAM-dependent methyltransferase [Candidatus Saccharimonadales bacterium]|jgi:ubiquinone/menaquinone biosynthesis C-methylase UbiE|nr:class I SAM-dependent methyltransferase [Candidatus Saccharimonadales bacterium]
MSTDKLSIDWYNQNSEEYTNHVRNPDDSIYHSLYEKPAMYSLLPNLDSMSVISLGCGSGEDCNYLAKHGASKVTGIDISTGMIEIAKKSYPMYQFQVMDMENLAFGDSSFDFAYSSLAIHYLEDWSKVFKEVYRVLKPGSYFLFSCNHPVTTAMEVIQDDGRMKIQQLSYTKNYQTNKVSIKGDYLKRRPLPSHVTLPVTTWHKPIGEISQEAVAAGFVIANIVEPKPLPKMEQISETNFKVLNKIPGFVILKLQKI